MRQNKETTIQDDFGTEHSYIVIQHGARDGARLAARVMRIVSGPLGALAAIAAGGDKSKAAEIDLSPEGLGNALRSAAVALVEEGTDSLLEDVFRFTVRDGKKLSGVEFDSAFQGNYGELVAALVMVLRHNFEASFRRVPFVGSLSSLGMANSTKSSSGLPSTGASGG